MRSITEMKCNIGHSWDKVHKNKSYSLFSPLIQWVHNCCLFRWVFESTFLGGLWIKIILWWKGEFKTYFQFTGSVKVLQEMLFTQVLVKESFASLCLFNLLILAGSIINPYNGSFSLLSWKKFYSREILGSVQSLIWFLKNLMQPR